jgi:hypothetical protein
MKNSYKKINRASYSLGELISIVSSCARDSKETVAAVADLLATGRVVIRSNAGLKRVRLA